MAGGSAADTSVSTASAIVPRGDDRHTIASVRPVCEKLPFSRVRSGGGGVGGRKFGGTEAEAYLENPSPAAPDSFTSRSRWRASRARPPP